MAHILKSLKPNLVHDDFVAAVTPLVKSVAEDRGDGELKVIFKKTPKDFIETLGRGFGPITIIPV